MAPSQTPIISESALRKMFREELAEFLREQVAQSALNGEQGDRDEDAVLSAVNEITTPLRNVEERLASIEFELQSLRTQQDGLMTSALTRFIPAGPFMSRCYDEQVFDKQALAMFAATSCFQNETRSIRCFIQASSTAFHLGWAMASSFLTNGSLVYTNSIVVPLPLLYGHAVGRPTVFTFCGWKFSPNCAGWTIPKNDGPALNSLRRQFSRENPDRLWRTIVSPMFVSSDTGLYYEEEENAVFSNCMGEADSIVLLVPGNRILEENTPPPSDRAYFGALQKEWSTSPEKFWLVVSQHDRPASDAVIKRFRDRGVRVSWHGINGWTNY